jgi:hypothetical protein
MNIIATANIILTLLPVVSDTVKNVEAFAGSGNGAAKQQAALGIIKSLYEASSPPVPFEQIVTQVTLLINEVVMFYNTIKAFSKSVRQVAA